MPDFRSAFLRKAAASIYTHYAALTLFMLGCADGEPLATSQALFSLETENGLSEPVVVYESVTTWAGDEIVETSVVGEISDELLQRVSRPWLYLGESSLYHEQIWVNPTGPDSREEGYRILATPNDTSVDYSVDATPFVLDPALLDALAQPDRPSSAVVVMNVRGLAPARIPLPPSYPMSAADLADAHVVRSAAVLERENEFFAVAGSVLNEIETLGGTVYQVGSRSGWILAELPMAAIPSLVGRADLYNLHAASLEGEFAWGLGDGRSDSRLGADRFHANGFTGIKSNLGRHSFGAVTLAIADTRLEDEACFLYTGACGGVSRLVERYSCYNANGNGDWCLGFQPSYADADTEPGHGTTVTSIAVGDYEDGQGDGISLGDPQWTSGAHTAAWEQDHSGMAPESRLIYFDLSADGTLDSRAATDSLVDAAAEHVDIFNGSWSLGGTPCAATATAPAEQALEDAFDDGVFVVMSAGNNRDSNGICNPSTWTQCSVPPPADTMKAFAVNAYDASTSACNGSINACEWDVCDYRLGGMDVMVNGSTHSGAVSVIAGLGPNGVTRTTNNQGAFGTVVSGGFEGTSAAAPHVAGLAALVKDQYLNTQFNSWVNSPGWIHTIMLAMTDRSYDAGMFGLLQRGSGSDNVYGFGKIRLRLLGTGGGLGAIGTGLFTLTFTSGSGLWATTLWPTAMPSNANLVKCVMFNAEDMSPPKVEISDIDLTLKLYNPGSGTSCSTLGALQSTRVDNSVDFKRMVAFEQPATTIANRCARLELSPQWIHPAQGVTTKVFCYYSTVIDDETPQ